MYRISFVSPNGHICPLSEPMSLPDAVTAFEHITKHLPDKDTGRYHDCLIEGMGKPYSLPLISPGKFDCL